MLHKPQNDEGHQAVHFLSGLDFMLMYTALCTEALPVLQVAIDYDCSEKATLQHTEGPRAQGCTNHHAPLVLRYS